MDLHLERYLFEEPRGTPSGGENDFINGSSPAAGMVDYATIIKPGEAIGTFWGYEWTGLDEKGHDTYTDVDGNQMIDGGDRKVIGKGQSRFHPGMEQLPCLIKTGI